MNESRLQVDTVRYFTLQSPNDLPVRAPRPLVGTYADACPGPGSPHPDEAERRWGRWCPRQESNLRPFA